MEPCLYRAKGADILFYLQSRFVLNELKRATFAGTRRADAYSWGIRQDRPGTDLASSRGIPQTHSKN